MSRDPSKHQDFYIFICRTAHAQHASRCLRTIYSLAVKVFGFGNDLCTSSNLSFFIYQQNVPQDGGRLTGIRKRQPVTRGFFPTVYVLPPRVCRVKYHVLVDDTALFSYDPELQGQHRIPYRDALTYLAWFRINSAPHSRGFHLVLIFFRITGSRWRVSSR